MCDRFSSLKKFSGEVRDASGNVIRKIKRVSWKLPNTRMDLLATIIIISLNILRRDTL